MTGRPTRYTNKLAAEIFERLMQGESLRSICRDEAMPCRATVHNWLASNPSFLDQYAKAREVQADMLFDEMLDIADDGSNDFYKRNDKDEPDYYEYRGEHVARSKLRIDARKWTLARMSPKKYGDKVEQTITGPNGGPVQVTRIELVAPGDNT